MLHFICYFEWTCHCGINGVSMYYQYRRVSVIRVRWDEWKSSENDWKRFRRDVAENDIRVEPWTVEFLQSIFLWVVSLLNKDIPKSTTKLLLPIRIYVVASFDDVNVEYDSNLSQKNYSPNNSLSRYFNKLCWQWHLNFHLTSIKR